MKLLKTRTRKQAKKVAKYGFATGLTALSVSAGSELAVGLLLVLLTFRKLRKFKQLMS